MDIEEVFKKVLDCCFRVHTELGPGLLESAYEACLMYELQQEGLKVRKQVAVPLFYKDVELDVGYRIDLLVNNEVIIELKSVDSIADIHLAQILTYMKLAECKLGLLVNFNVKHLENGIKRVIL
ncbi:GxxExxY protein [Labilibaculum antarcticum]|uniref:GxxExxY protein n=1 Tax=Labilibaculum antarcticum TaxID=1717717 RepID=A0A1Y1CNX5_9BACT|nr:GxxExxY protein [Labilibaculum antarcticum]BAX82116.1 GxxExxY protein [Labilibaculum antarcticum]